MRVVSVNIGEEATIEIRDRDVRTGIYKRPRSGPQRVDAKGFVGDTVVEARRGSTGDQAVSVYPLEHYAEFADALTDEAPGAFGENLTTEGLLEEESRIGDVFRVGSATLQVSHPRLPCRKLDHRHGRGFSRRFLRSRHVGFYLRVIEPGMISAGDAIALIDRDAGSPTVDEFVRVTQLEYWDREGLQRAHQARDLAPEWRELVGDKLGRAHAAEGWFGERTLVVKGIRAEAGDIARVDLACARGRPLPPFSPGQLLPLSFPSPDGSRAYQRRSYCLVGGASGGERYEIAGRLRDSSRMLFAGKACSHLPATLASGDAVASVAPRGLFALPGSSAGPLLFVTEGLGSAPVLTMLRELAARGEPVHGFLAHCDVGPKTHAFAEATRSFCERLGIGTRTYYRSPTEALAADPTIHTGWPDVAELLEWSRGPAPRTVLLAGSESYVDHVSARLGELGSDSLDLRTLSFGAGDE